MDRERGSRMERRRSLIGDDWSVRMVDGSVVVDGSVGVIMFVFVFV